MAKVARRRDRYVIDFYDQHGSRRWHTMPKGATRKEAHEKMGELLKNIRRGDYVPPGKIPAFSSVADAWLESKGQTVRGSTHGSYDGHVKNHLKPFFGDFRIDHINFDLIEKYKTHALEAGTSIPTLKKILTTLGGIMKHAVRMRLIEHRPEIEKPRGASLHEDRHELAILKPTEIRALIENADGQRDRILFTTAVMTGMRQGELLGLTWEDIDWMNRQALVRRSYNHGTLYEPKTRTSRRRIDLAPELVRDLKAWKIACPISTHNLVFPTPEGEHEKAENTLYRRFFAALRRAGLPEIRFHALRHTFASLLIDQGENIKYVQTQLGHASIQMTIDVYGHLMKDTNRGAAAKLGRAVLGARKTATTSATITRKNSPKQDETGKKGKAGNVYEYETLRNSTKQAESASGHF